MHTTDKNDLALFAERVQHLVPEGAYQMLARAQALEAAGRQIIHLEAGQPDVLAFDNIVRAGIRAIEAGHTRYGPPAGLPALRRAIAEDAGRRRGIEVRPAQVVVGPGAKPAMFFPTLALVRPGDEVIYPDPGFPTYLAMIGVAGGVAISGIFELEPIRLNYLNDKLRLDAAEAERNSPIRHLPERAAPLVVTVGLGELPELIRQSEEYAAAWQARGHRGRYLPLPAHDHFSILEELAQPGGALVKALRELHSASA